MASHEQEQPVPEETVQIKQDSPVKDAVRSLEAQLASETSDEKAAPQEVPTDMDASAQDDSTVEVPLHVPVSLIPAEGDKTSVEDTKGVEHVVVHVYQNPPTDSSMNQQQMNQEQSTEHQHVVINQERMEHQQVVINQEHMEHQHVVINQGQSTEHQHVVINQGQSTEHQHVVINQGQSTEHPHVVINQEQPMEHQQIIINQEQPVVEQQQQIVLNQEHGSVQQQQIIIHQEQAPVSTTYQPHQVVRHLQPHEEVMIQQGQPVTIAEQMLHVIAGDPQQEQKPQIVQPQESQSSGESSQGSGSEKENPVFKCVAVSSDGNPDWSKVMNLNRDILKEVLEKHGISMEGDWPTQQEESDYELKKKRKEKKAKKKKKKDKKRGLKDGDDNTYCDICCRNFENSGSLKHHRHIHEDQNDGPRKCSICSLVFQRKIGLRAHMRKSHPEDYSKTEETKDDGEFPCEEEGCERTFTTKMGLSQHLNQHHKGIGKKKNLLKRSPEDLRCDKCDKTFTLPHKLTQHMVMHSEERPYKCKQCDGTFKHHSSLRTHELIHSNKDACSCPVCGTMFKRAQYVRRHMIRVHDLLGVNYIPPAPVKRYPCELCHRAYERKSELADHMNSHTGAKPHLCEICAKGFAHKRALDVHRKTHTGKGAFHCDVCAKVFGSKSRMKEHRVIHTGEKPFICQQCGTRFAHRANLREHLKSVHKSGMEPLPRGRKKQKRGGALGTDQEIQQPTLQYEILTTRPHPQIEEAQATQVHTTTQVVPVGIHQHPQQVGQEQPQIMYQEIQLQPVSNMRPMQVGQVQGQQVIEARQDDLASVAQIVLQLHTEGTTFTVQ